MITNFSVSNFKSFCAEAEATLGQVLVLSGPNSCGKTTLIQALLLLSQSQSHQNFDVALDLGGRYVHFAEFRDAVFGRPPNSKAQFSISFCANLRSRDYLSWMKALPTLSTKALLDIPSFTRRWQHTKNADPLHLENKYRVRITFAATPAGKPLVKHLQFSRNIADKFEISYELVRTGKSYSVAIRSQPLGTWSSDINLVDAESKLRKIVSDISEAVDTLNRNTQRQFRLSNRPIGRFIQDLINLHGVQTSTFLESLSSDTRNVAISDNSEYPPHLHELFIELTRRLLEYGSAQEVKITFNLNHDNILLNFMPWHNPRRIAIWPRGRSSNNERFLLAFSNTFSACVTEIRHYIGNVDYVGPLRAKPEKAYLPTGTHPGMGNTGENAVPLLWLKKNETVTFKCKPGEASVKKPLHRAVAEWFEQFGIAYSFHITKPRNVIYQAELDGPAGSGTRVTIADVGFGVSQLLPVILAGLLAPEETTLIFEQPEIHLHPKLQAKLADFFICLTELNKRVIVETHSEHLINMLRLRTVEDTTGELQHKLRISFVQAHSKTSDDELKGSFISNLELDKYGQITNWPPDFFPEHGDITEKILMAMLAKS